MCWVCSQIFEFLNVFSIHSVLNALVETLYMVKIVSLSDLVGGTKITRMDSQSPSSPLCSLG